MKNASLVGRRIAKLVVVRLDGSTHAICKCDCGNEIRVWKANLYRNNTRSCGCSKRTAGGLYKTFKSEYESWSHMIERCTDQTSKSWPDYGGRGLSVCDAWLSFPQFLADMGPKPSSGLTIERINNKGHYAPSNCRWATRAEQNRNTRKNRYISLNGQTKTVSEWSRETGISHTALLYRLARGKTGAEALKPIRR